MESGTTFDPIWSKYADFKFTGEQVGECPFAREFLKWTQDLCATATQGPTIVSLNQNYILLLNKFFEWRSIIPQSHRNRIGKVGHLCVFQVFEQAYHTLKALELSLTPPMLFVPPVPPAPPAPTIPGLFLGEVEEKSDGRGEPGR